MMCSAAVEQPPAQHPTPTVESAESAASRPAASGGHDESVQSLYSQHAAALLSFVLRLVGGDRQTAEDIVQETFLRAWRSAGRLDDTGPSVRPWLFTVARHIVIDQHRRRSARPAEVDAGILELVPAHDAIDERLSSLAMSDAMSVLSAAHRQVIVELYYRGSKVNEAAESLGLAPGTVKSRAYYGLRALRLVLEERGLAPA
jgi:RNA polymerase sigma-70 factor, ECF subfamily